MPIPAIIAMAARVAPTLGRLSTTTRAARVGTSVGRAASFMSNISAGPNSSESQQNESHIGDVVSNYPKV